MISGSEIDVWFADSFSWLIFKETNYKNEED